MIWSTRSPSVTMTALRGDVLRVVDLPRLRLLAERGVRLLDEPRHVHLLVPDREAPRVELRQVENVSDQALEAAGFGRDHVEREVPRLRIFR